MYYNFKLLNSIKGASDPFFLLFEPKHAVAVFFNHFLIFADLPLVTLVKRKIQLACRLQLVV
jgi:hypothetical protein